MGDSPFDEDGKEVGDYQGSRPESFPVSEGPDDDCQVLRWRTCVIRFGGQRIGEVVVLASLV